MSDIRTSDREPATIDYLGAVRRRWWIVVLGIVVGIAAGLAVAAVQTKVYDATASVLVQETGAPNTGQVVNARTNSGINLDTESQVVMSQVVAARAQSILKTKTPAAQLISNVSVTVPPNSSVLAIAYSAPTAKAAQQGARAFAQAYLANRGDQATKQVAGQVAALQAQRLALDKQLSDASGQIASLPPTSVQRQQAQASSGIISNQLSALGGQLTTLSSADITPGTILTDAALPTKPTSPNKLLDLGGGLLAGLLLGLIVAFVVERSDRRIYSADDAGRRAALPLLASLPRKRFPNRLAAPGDAAGAHIGRLRNALAALLADREMLASDSALHGPRTVVVCGGRTDDTNGVVAANLAAAMAASGYRVTLVCADRSSSSLALLGASADRPGLTEVLRDGTPPGDVTHPSAQPGLSVMGPGADQPMSLERGLRLLHRGTGDPEAVLMVEVPLAQAELLSRRADVTLAVVVLRRATRTLVTDMGAGLDRNRSRLVVLSPVKGRVKGAPDAVAPVDDVSPARARVAGAGQSSRR